MQRGVEDATLKRYLRWLNTGKLEAKAKAGGKPAGRRAAAKRKLDTLPPARVLRSGRKRLDLVAKQSETGQRMLTFFQSLLWHSMRLETSSTSRNVPTCSTLTAASRVCYVALLGNETP